MKKAICLKYIYVHITQMQAVWDSCSQCDHLLHSYIKIHEPVIMVIIMEPLGIITKSQIADAGNLRFIAMDCYLVYRMQRLLYCII